MEMLTKDNYRSLLSKAYEDIMMCKRSRVSFDTKNFGHIVALTKKRHGVHLFIQSEGTIEFTTMVYSLEDMKDYLDMFIISYTWRLMLRD